MQIFQTSNTLLLGISIFCVFSKVGTKFFKHYFDNWFLTSVPLLNLCWAKALVQQNVGNFSAIWVLLTPQELSAIELLFICKIWAGRFKFFVLCILYTLFRFTNYHFPLSITGIFWELYCVGLYIATTVLEEQVASIFNGHDVSHASNTLVSYSVNQMGH
jgi:hypothetical protein